MAKQAVATRTDLDPIDRLEEKVKLLVGVVTQLRQEHAKAVDDNSRLMRELESMRARLAESEATRQRADGAARRARPHPRARRRHARAARVDLNVRPSLDDEQRDHGRNRRPALSDPQRARRALRHRAGRLRRSEDARRLRFGAGQRHARPGRARRAQHRRRILPRARARGPSTGSWRACTSARCASSASWTKRSRKSPAKQAVLATVDPPRIAR